MDSKQKGRLNIGVSLLFAMAILVSSYLLKETDYQEMATFLLIALWWVPFSYLSKKETGSKLCNEQ